MTGGATPSWVEDKSVQPWESCHRIVREMTAILTMTRRRRHAGRLGVVITAISIMLISSSEVIPGWPKDAVIQKLHKLDDTTSRILDDQPILDNSLETIRLHGGDYEANSGSMLVQQQGVVET